MYFQNQYNLRSINVVIYPPKRTFVNQTSANQLTQNFPNKDVQQKNVEKDLPKENVSKEKDLQKDE